MLQNDGLYHSDEVYNNYFGSRPHQAPTNLAKHFPVIITPEASTSKTCFFCDGMRSAVVHKTMRREHIEQGRQRIANGDPWAARLQQRGLQCSLGIPQPAAM